MIALRKRNSLKFFFSCSRVLHLHNYGEKNMVTIRERGYEKSNLMNVIFICLFYAP